MQTMSRHGTPRPGGYATASCDASLTSKCNQNHHHLRQPSKTNWLY